MANPVVHWEIGGRDLDTTAAFYRDLFGWEASSHDENYRLIDVDEGIGGGFMRCHDGMPAYVTFYVSVADLDATLAKAKDLGGTAIVPPTPIPGVGAFAMFQDPDGNAIGILQFIPPE